MSYFTSDDEYAPVFRLIVQSTFDVSHAIAEAEHAPVVTTQVGTAGVIVEQPAPKLIVSVVAVD